MKSGLEGRNNQRFFPLGCKLGSVRLNEVRPGRPEQSYEQLYVLEDGGRVSMKSGLEGRNNLTPSATAVR